MPYRTYTSLQGDVDACESRYHAAEEAADRAYDDLEGARARLDERFPLHGPRRQPLIPDALTQQIYGRILGATLLHDILDSLEG